MRTTPTARLWCSGSARRWTPARFVLPPTGCRAPAASCRSMRSPTTSPSMPPNPSPPRPAIPANLLATGYRQPALLSPLQADDRCRLAAGRPACHRQPPAAQGRARARLGRSLPDQVPALLNDLRSPASCPRRLLQTSALAPVLVVKSWSYDGTGYVGSGEAELALASAARARDKEQLTGVLDRP